MGNGWGVLSTLLRALLLILSIFNNHLINNVLHFRLPSLPIVLLHMKGVAPPVP